MPAKRMPSLLIFKLGAIGDVIMAIPAARLMHEEGYQVDWICGTTVAPLLRLFPWINIIAVDEAALLRGTLFSRSSQVLRLWRRIALRRYDLCVTLYYDARLRLLTLPSASVVRVCLSFQNRTRQLLPGRHHTDEFARILLRRVDGERPRHLAPLLLSSTHPQLPANPLPRTSKVTRVVIFPAGARNVLRDDALRRWPIESYVAVVKALTQLGYEVVLAGGHEDGWASASFRELSVVNLIGVLSLPETLSVLVSSDLVVTHDTGPLHLAGITSVALVAIFGPTDPHSRLPQRPNAVALWGGSGFACRPCYDGRDFAPCSNNGCMQSVSPAMVLEQIEILLAARRDGCVIPAHVVATEFPSPHFVRLSSISQTRVAGAKHP
jgi:heptosyltransferase-2